MKDIGKHIIFAIIFLTSVLAVLPFFKHTEFTAQEAIVCKCICIKCQSTTNEFYKVGGGIANLSDLLKEEPATNEWEQGEFVTFRKSLAHAGCGGQMNFNGQAKPAPYSEREQFYTHVCSKCSTTNQILNATWPQYKQEWRSR
jgi:hypothetical protein